MTKKYKNSKKIKIQVLMDKQELYSLIEDLTDEEINQVYDWLSDLQRRP